MTVTQFPPKAYDTPILVELRTSLPVATLTWALIAADHAVKGMPIPDKITDVHPFLRRRYEDKALTCLLSCQRDADVYAEVKAQGRAFELFAAFVEEHQLDWCDRFGDTVEVLIAAIGQAAVKRYMETLNGIAPGLEGHLARIAKARDGEAV